jgi:hypothetical protein
MPNKIADLLHSAFGIEAAFFISLVERPAGISTLP